MTTKNTTHAFRMMRGRLGHWIVGLAAIALATPAAAQLASTGAEASPVLSCFYECKPGPEVQGESTYRQITTLPVVNHGQVHESVDVNFIDGNGNVIATTDLDLPARDVDELAVCNTIEAITEKAPPKAGMVQIGNLASVFGQGHDSGVYSWIKNVSGRFFADNPEPFEGRVRGIAKSECKYVATYEVNEPINLASEGGQVPSGAPILVEDTDDGGGSSGSADLVPVPDGSGFFCRIDPSGNLEVEIANQGTGAAGATTTQINWTSGGGTTSFTTPPLAPGTSSTVSVPIPLACFGGSCFFEISADETDVETESNEANNQVSDFCLG